MIASHTPAGNEQLIAAQLRDHVRDEVARLPLEDARLVESLARTIRAEVTRGDDSLPGLGQLALALASVELQAALSHVAEPQTEGTK